jgi:hypothetical protein
MEVFLRGPALLLAFLIATGCTSQLTTDIQPVCSRDLSGPTLTIILPNQKKILSCWVASFKVQTPADQFMALSVSGPAGVIWKIEKERMADTYEVTYGAIPPGCVQVFPEYNKEPVALKKNVSYTIRVTFDQADTMKKVFVFTIPPPELPPRKEF